MKIGRETMPSGGGRATPYGWQAFKAPNRCVFISHRSTNLSSLARIVELSESVSRSLATEAVMLVDRSEHIQAVLQERLLVELRLPTNFTIWTFVFTPGLASRLGPWRTRRLVATGVHELELPSSMSIDTDTSDHKLYGAITAWLSNHRAARKRNSVEDQAPIASASTAESDVGDLIGLRKRLRESVAMLDSEQWGEWRGVSTNPSATLAKYREQGRLFAVREGRSYLYPRFQFGHDAAPLDAVADVLNVVPEDAKGWPLLSWFDAPSVILKGRKPREVLSKNPSAVKEAAADFYSDD